MKKLEVKKVNMIDFSDWDKLVEETYGRKYSFQQQDGCKDRGTVELIVPQECNDVENDTVPEIVNHNDMGVSFKAWLARDPKKQLPNKEDKDSFSLNLWWERNFYPDVQMVANDLHAKGLLEAGKYLINIDW